MSVPRYAFRSVQFISLVSAFVVCVTGVVWSEVAFAQSQDRLRELEQRFQEVRDEQLRRTHRLETLERRLEFIDALDLQRRLTRLETLSEANRTLLLTITGALVLQVIAASVGVIRSFARRPDPEGR